MKICIIGSSGFIGQNFLSEIADTDYETICYSRKNKSLSLQECVQQCDIIFHMAGALGHYGQTNEALWNSNVLLTRKIVEYCAHQKIVYVSSAGIHGICEDVDEDSAPNPQNSYEQSKNEAEAIIQNYHHHIIIRPGLLFGPHDLHLLPLFKWLTYRYFTVLGSGKNIVQPTYITDLTKVLIKMISNQCKNETYLIAGNKITIADFYRAIAHALENKTAFIPVPRFFAFALGYMNEILSTSLGLPLVLTTERVRLLASTRTYNTSKATSDLNFIPTPLEKALTQTIWYYKSNKLI